MNKTLLLILCDFLLLNLLALTRWEKAEPPRAKQPPVPEMAANAVSKDQDLVATMRESLADEQSARVQLEQKLSSAESAVSAREQNLAQIQQERERLAASLTQTRQSAAELGRQVTAATQEATMTKAELARLQLELERRRDEAERQQQALAQLQQQQSAAKQQIESLNVAVQVAQQEKQLLNRNLTEAKQQIEVERTERAKVQETTTRLASGVGQLAEQSGALTREIRDNRPINANVLFNDFLANRVTAKFTAVRPGLFNPATREKAAATVLVTDGSRIYALVHSGDTPFALYPNSYDWKKIAVEFLRDPGYRSAAPEFSFLAADPRIVVVPVDAGQAAALGVKVYATAADPFKFPEAVLVSGGGQGYGEVGFKLDASQPGYVRVDNRLFKRLFGDFAPSRGDLVFSKTGEILGIMVNSDYCVVLRDFLPARTLQTGEDVSAQAPAALLDGLAARVQALPLKLQ